MAGFLQLIRPIRFFLVLMACIVMFVLAVMNAPSCGSASTRPTHQVLPSQASVGDAVSPGPVHSGGPVPSDVPQWLARAPPPQLSAQAREQTSPQSPAPAFEQTSSQSPTQAQEHVSSLGPTQASEQARAQVESKRPMGHVSTTPKMHASKKRTKRPMRTLTPYATGRFDSEYAFVEPRHLLISLGRNRGVLGAKHDNVHVQPPSAKSLEEARGETWAVIPTSDTQYFIRSARGDGKYLGGDCPSRVAIQDDVFPWNLDGGRDGVAIWTNACGKRQFLDSRDGSAFLTDKRVVWFPTGMLERSA